MAFWGVEVKPGKPVTHLCEKARGRLRISQATLGISTATNKSIVQCNVGKRSPVLLCVLLPNHTESCHLDLEFEEADDVVFSVIGPRSVYLTGYYVRQSPQTDPHSDTESFGVDIADTQTEESSRHTDDDKYEGSFIDDDELQEFSPSPVFSSKLEDETTSKDDKPKAKNGRGKRLKKKSQVVESDKDASSHESEDEDGYLLSIFKSKRAAKTTSAGVEANSVSQHLPTINGKDQMHTLDLANAKNKRKEHPKEEKTSEVQIDEDLGVPGEDNKHELEALKNMEIGDQVPPRVSSSINRKKSKKRRIEQLEGTPTEGIGAELHNVTKNDKPELDSLHADSEKKSLPEASGVQEQQIDNNVSKDSESLANASQTEKETKRKTKKKKNQGERDLKIAVPDTRNNQDNTTFDNQTTNQKPRRNRTLSNGLIIEEVANGPPDGKVAIHGKKVKIFYIATLKENGYVFDSNVNKNPCKFRLGDKEVCEGWNLGIDGMHVGDKRRLIIPPPMGSGKYGAGENVPPNSWLVYDVELVNVRR